MPPPIDFTRRFIPERLTPLFHTPLYGRLSPVQRLRYNQLHAAYFNEQIIFFEREMAQPILKAFLKRNLPDTVIDSLRTSLEEESAHSEMFRALNRQSFPEHYARRDFYFIRLPRCVFFGLRQWLRYAGSFPFFLWVLLIQEERAVFCAREFLADADGLEPGYAAAQRRHLADEAGHVAADEQLMDWIWPRLSASRRRINARLFAWMMREYFTAPKRSGLRVVAELVSEFSELKALWPKFRQQMLGVWSRRQFNELAYSRTVTPKAFARFDQCPEFASLGKVLPAYEPTRKECIRAESSVTGQ